MHDYRFPGETPTYRSARDELLKAELELRRQTERVADQRRKLPLGAPIPEDYVFEETSGKVRFSELFASGKDTLVLYSFMFSPEMKAACPMCTSFLDGLHGNAVHLRQRINLAVVAKSPIARVQDFATSRGWKELRMLSSAGTTFNRDYHGDCRDGSQNSIIHTFVKKGGKVHHGYSSELTFLSADKGQNQRHLDAMWTLWNVLDITPEGRGGDWYPRLSYG